MESDRRTYHESLFCRDLFNLFFVLRDCQYSHPITYIYIIYCIIPQNLERAFTTRSPPPPSRSRKQPTDPPLDERIRALSPRSASRRAQLRKAAEGTSASQDVVSSLALLGGSGGDLGGSEEGAFIGGSSVGRLVGVGVRNSVKIHPNK